MQKHDHNHPVRLKVLETSFYAFNQRGYKRVSMDLVARELRISKKTIYVHFDSKEEILETAIEELFSQVHANISQAILLTDGYEAIIAIFKAYKSFNQTFSHKLREEIKHSMPHLEDRILAYERRVIHQKISKWLKGIRKSKFVTYPSPSRELTATLIGMMHGVLDAPEDKVQFLLQSMVKGMHPGKKKRK